MLSFSIFCFSELHLALNFNFISFFHFLVCSLSLHFPSNFVIFLIFFFSFFLPYFCSRLLHDPYENFTCHFICEKHMELEHLHLWNFHFTYELGAFSQMKYLIYMWNELIQDFTCEILVYKTFISRTKWSTHIWKLISPVKLSFRLWNWNSSHMKHYFYWRNYIWNFCKRSLEVYPSC